MFEFSHDVLAKRVEIGQSPFKWLVGLIDGWVVIRVPLQTQLVRNLWMMVLIRRTTAGLGHSEGRYSSLNFFFCISRSVCSGQKHGSTDEAFTKLGLVVARFVLSSLHLHPPVFELVQSVLP